MYTKTPPASKPFAFIMQMSRPDAWLMAAGFLFTGIGQVLDLVYALYLGYLIDVISKTNEATVFVWLLIAFYPTLILMQAVNWRISTYIMSYVEGRIYARGNLQLFAYLTDHGMEYFSNRFAGSVSNKISTAARGAVSIIEQCIWNYWTLLISLVGSAVYALLIDWRIALIILVSVSIMVPVNMYFAKGKAVLAEHAENVRTKLRGSIVDSITNIATVIHFAARGRELARTEGLVMDSYRAELKSSFYSNMMMLGNGVGLFVFSIAVLFVSLYLWSSGAITAGTLVTLLVIMSNLLWGFSHVGSQINEFAEAYGEIQNGLHDVVVPHDVVDAPDAQPLKVASGGVMFDKVTFGYTDKNVFTDFNLAINAGQRIGLVGPSGAGKTTLVALLLRNADVQGGAITIDGIDIRSVTQDSLHEAIAIVPQDPLLFHRTIKENIAYGKPDATDAEVEEAAKKAQAHDFIVAQKDGYNTMVGERGIKLSGGQRQRIAIARAILKAAPILVLDEATSSLDSESESEIQTALQELMKNKTVIAIAHRLSTIKQMDRIVVMKDGAVVEDGPHEELVKIEGGLYARLWAHQAGGFLEE